MALERRSIAVAAVLLLSLVWLEPGWGKAWHGEAHVAVIDADTLQPVEGAAVAFAAGENTLPSDSPQTSASPFLTDGAGLAKPTGEIGRSTTHILPVLPMPVLRGRTPHMLVTLAVERSGYKAFRAECPVVTVRGSTLYLPDVLLAKQDSPTESARSTRGLQPTRCRIERPYGSAGQSLKVTVDLAVPRSFLPLVDRKTHAPLQLYMHSGSVWRGRIRLSADPAAQAASDTDLVFSGSFTLGKTARPGAYPVDVEVMLDRDPYSTERITRGAAHFAVGETEASAKDLYDRLIAPAGGDQQAPAR